MRLGQLKILAVVAPIVFLVTLEGLRFYILEPHVPRPQVHVTMIALELFGIVVFWWIVWRAIEAIERELKRLSALEERERIAMDLHDGIVQQLYGLGLSLEGAAGLVESSPSRVRSEIDRAIDRLGEIVADIRHYILDLRWDASDGGDFPRLVRKLVDDVVAPSGMRREVRVTGRFEGLSRHVQWELWHIAQEALANAVRHGGGTRVGLSLVRERDRVRLLVTDNGRGFRVRRGVDAWKAETDGIRGGDAHHGYGNMEKRARALGGSLTVRSAPGRGTEVEAVVPVGSRAAGGAESDAPGGDGRKGSAGQQDVIG